jgi:hypothetical protein
MSFSFMFNNLDSDCTRTRRTLHAYPTAGQPVVHDENGDEVNRLAFMQGASYILLFPVSCSLVTTAHPAPLTCDIRYKTTIPHPHGLVPNLSNPSHTYAHIRKIKTGIRSHWCRDLLIRQLVLCKGLSPPLSRNKTGKTSLSPFPRRTHFWYGSNRVMTMAAGTSQL